jgi:hypothetical protein
MALQVGCATAKLLMVRAALHDVHRDAVFGKLSLAERARQAKDQTVAHVWLVQRSACNFVLDLVRPQNPADGGHAPVPGDWITPDEMIVITVALACRQERRPSSRQTSCS